MTNNLLAMTAVELGECYRRGEASPVEMAQATLGQIEKHNETLNCICLVDEEITLEFPVKGLPKLQKNHVRSYLLFATGFCKDMDPHTAFGDTVEPLPFHGMSGYPYGNNETYPDDADHRAYRKTYNTRHLRGR